MTNLYVREGEEYKKSGTLFGTLTSEAEGYIEGIRFVENQVIQTALRGMKYPFLDGCPYKNFLSDEGLDLVANILVPRREIWMVRLSNPANNRRPNLYYDSSKAMGEGIFYYDGDMKEALSEFVSRGFRLNIVRQPSGLEDLRKVLDMKSKRVPQEERFFIERENVSLDEAVRTPTP